MESIGAKSISLFQWNVLTQAFCNHKSYPEDDYPSEALDATTRRDKIVKEISRAIGEKRTIVLHEVDRELRGVLTVMADAANYGMASQGHGYWRNWYMGSMVMWPRDTCQIATAEYLTVGDLIKENVDDPSPPPPGCLMKPLVAAYRWAVGAEPDQGYYYRKAVRRSNVLIHAEIQDQELVYHVWAYHMPCAFREPAVMEYHAQAVIDAVRDAPEGLHFICMDGNFQPDSDLYQRFVENGFTSAAVASGDGEPAWTSRSNSYFGGGFTGTLDYVWIKDSAAPKRVDNEVSLVDYVWVKNPVDVAYANPQGDPSSFLPSVSFPSDHLWMRLGYRINQQ